MGNRGLTGQDCRHGQLAWHRQKQACVVDGDVMAAEGIAVHRR
jgi:hypothetical protein